MLTPALANWDTIGSNLTAAEAQKVLSIHNEARKAVGVGPLDKDKTLWISGCGKSAAGAFCDGTHKK